MPPATRVRLGAVSTCQSIILTSSSSSSSCAKVSSCLHMIHRPRASAVCTARVLARQRKTTAPARTKSGEGGALRGSNGGDDENHVEQSIYYAEKLPDHDSYEDDVSPTSPLYRELALKRNSARRQRSSDMLGAMRDATRNLPARSQSTSLVNGRRRGPSRTKSGGLMSLSDELASPGRKPLRRKAPPRTAPPLET